MKEVDYIVVGCGLAGIAFCEQLNQHNKSFVVFDNQSQQSSIVAAGLYNAVVLKRFTEVWKPQEQLQLLQQFYHILEQRLRVKLDYKLPLYRRFASVEEQNDWFAASDKPQLASYLSDKLIKNNNTFINAPLGFGKVLQTGRIDTKTLVLEYKNLLKKTNSYISEAFDHEHLLIGNKISYKNIYAKNIVFAEGFGMINNPFFKHLPLNVAKGEIITIRAPKLQIDFVLKSSIFIIPEGKDLYFVGATYDWNDKTNLVTEEAKKTLIAQLRSVIFCDFEVVNQVAGIRPTVKDRKPLIGVHQEHKNVAILNGLGTRGVMLAPYVAKQLYEHMEFQKPLDAEIDIHRFH